MHVLRKSDSSFPRYAPPAVPNGPPDISREPPEVALKGRDRLLPRNVKVKLGEADAIGYYVWFRLRQSSSHSSNGSHDDANKREAIVSAQGGAPGASFIIKNAPPGRADAQAPGAQDPDDAMLWRWVQHRYTALLKRMVRNSDESRAWHLMTSMIIIAGGFATSGIAVAVGSKKGTGTAWVVFGIGVIVALAGGIAQIFRLAQRASGWAELAESLRAEGWALVNGHDPYSTATLKGQSEFEVFDRNISEIHHRADTLGRLETPTGNAGRGGARASRR